MKKILYCAFTLLFLFSLMGCSKQEVSETDRTPDEIAANIVSSQRELPELRQMTSEDTEFDTWLSDYYLLQPEKVAEGIIYYADGIEASEIAVLQLMDEKDGKEVEEALNEYIWNRASVFEGYAPQQAAMVKDGIVAVKGRYMALIICSEPEKAKETFEECFGKDSIEQEETEAGYNEEAILQAWKSGDDSSLSEINRSILNAARNVVESEIDDNMSDYEKELAIHDFITDWSRFDYSVFGRDAEGGFKEESATPYGVLINKSAMCHGYSSTFQLFMDMLDIECMTVYGIPGSNGVEHSWNMVKLDGEWYCVDCAWDDPIGAAPGHTYFNVTSDYLRKGSIHRWDESSIPEAAGTDYAYGKHR